jgi:hypothetical protein
MGKKLIFSAITLLVAFVYYDWHFSRPASYLAFKFHRSEKYYSRFADGCVELIDHIGKGQTNEYRMEGDDSRLPAIIKDARPTYINVNKNRVQVVFEIAAHYGVVWDKWECYPWTWHLTIFGEAPPYTLYTRENTN